MYLYASECNNGGCITCERRERSDGIDTVAIKFILVGLAPLTAAMTWGMTRARTYRNRHSSIDHRNSRPLRTSPKRDRHNRFLSEFVESFSLALPPSFALLGVCHPSLGEAKS